MDIREQYEIFELISAASKHLIPRKQAILLRQAGINSQLNNSGFTKLAFDTRRTNQETEYNPRRGLQNWQRSEAFLSEALGNKIKNLSVLRDVLVKLENQYGREHEWQDSNARVLLATLNNGLRIMQKDGDYAINQPAQGSLDYIEELLYMRYRLNLNELAKISTQDLEKIILSKDEELIRKDINQPLQSFSGNEFKITKSDIGTQSYDTLMNKLFNVQATAEHPDIERTVSITIRDIIKK